MNQIPKPLVDLLNKTDEGYLPFAFAHPTTVLRVVAKMDFTTFRVERLTLTHKDPNNPRGGWHTISTHADSQPGAMLGSAMEALAAAQKSLIARNTRRLQSAT